MSVRDTERNAQRRFAALDVLDRHRRNDDVMHSAEFRDRNRERRDRTDTRSQGWRAP